MRLKVIRIYVLRWKVVQSKVKLKSIRNNSIISKLYHVIGLYNKLYDERFISGEQKCLVNKVEIDNKRKQNPTVYILDLKGICTIIGGINIIATIYVFKSSYYT